MVSYRSAVASLRVVALAAFTLLSLAASATCEAGMQRFQSWPWRLDSELRDFTLELRDDSGSCIEAPSRDKVGRALLIGAYNYEQQGHTLAGPPNDVVLFANALQVRGVRPENIQRLVGNTTREKTLEALSRMLSESQCGDMAFLLYGGHALKADFVGSTGESKPLGGDWRPTERAESHAALVLEDARPSSTSTRDPDALRSVSGLVFDSELESFAKAMRRKGVDLTIVLDTHETRDLIKPENVYPAGWKCCEGADKSILSEHLGRLFLLYSPTAAIELGLPKSSSQPKMYGAFSFFAGMELAKQEHATARALARAIHDAYMKEVAEMCSPQLKNEGRCMPFFFATDPDAVMFSTSRRTAANGVKLELVQAVQDTRGATRLSSGKVAGKINPADGLVAVVAAGKTADVARDGSFSVELPLKRGDNQVDIVAVFSNRPHHVEHVVVHSSAGQYEVTRPPRTFAVLIGNEAYGSESGFAPLKTPHRDVAALEKLLGERYGMQTHVDLPGGRKRSLLLHDASRDEIFSTLTLVSRIAEPDDSVLIFYAGHGKAEQLGEGLKKAYWIPSRSKLESEGSDWVSANDLNGLIARIRARHVLLIADSCYSGVLAESRGEPSVSIDPEAKDRYLSQMSRKKSRFLISSGGDEPVSDGGGDGHSIFARTLINALEKPTEPIFTAAQLFYGQIQQKVGANSEQMPQLQVIRDVGHDGGNFVFFSRAK